MKRQQGKYSFDFGGLVLFLILVGMVLGASGIFLVKWLWTFLKPWLHTLTA